MHYFKEKFKVDELLITTVGVWNISLRPIQVTLGSMILSMDRKCPNLGEITKEEGEELSNAFRMIEDLLKDAFKPDKVNYLALMMVDSQVHFHVIPRYKKEVKFLDRAYIDRNWPKPPDLLQGGLEMNEEELQKVRTYLSTRFRH